MINKKFCLNSYCELIMAELYIGDASSLLAKSSCDVLFQVGDLSCGY